LGWKGTCTPKIEMNFIEYTAKILPDGHLSVTEECKNALHLDVGSTVKVILIKSVSDSEEPSTMGDKEFEELLVEGYLVNAQRDKKICEEFKYVDAENLPPEY